MEFTFEYKNGKIKLYHGIGKVQKEVDIKELGWNSSPQFTYVAKKIYKAFNKSITSISKGKGQKNLIGRLTLDLKYSIRI